MGTRKWGKFTGILTILVMLYMALGGALIPGTAYAQGTWNVMTHPTTSGLYSVWGSSASDVFTVGDAGTILHYDGTWNVMTSVPTGTLISVWGSGPDDVFAVGVSGTIWHYDGTWSAMSSPTTDALRGVWGSSASNIFAVGDGGIILHYDGTWSTTSSPTSNQLLGVWGSSASDVFAVGLNGTILHYDGAWSAMPNIPTTDSLWGVWGSSASDVFAVGDGGIILHYEGSAWSAMSSPNTTYLTGVWGSSASNVFAVGMPDAILHYSGGGGGGGNTGVVSVTAEVAQVSVTVNPNSVSYGLVPLNTTGLQPINNPRIMAMNTGNCFVDMFIRGANTTNWALGTSPGDETYVHYYVQGPPGGLVYNPLTLSNQDLGPWASYSPGTAGTFWLQMDTPTASTATGTQSTTVMVMVTYEEEGIRAIIDANGPYIENVSTTLTVTANVTDQNGNPVLGIPNGNFKFSVFSGTSPAGTLVTGLTASWIENGGGTYTGSIIDISTLPAGPYFVLIGVNDGSHAASAGDNFEINTSP